MVISKQQIAELKKGTNKLRKYIEHTEKVLEDKVASVEDFGNIGSRAQEMYDYQRAPAFIEDN